MWVLENVFDPKKSGPQIVQMNFNFRKTYVQLPLSSRLLGTPDLPRGLKRCFKGFVLFLPEIAHNQFFPRSHLVLFLQQFARKTVDNSVEPSEQN